MIVSVFPISFSHIQIVNDWGWQAEMSTIEEEHVLQK